MGMEVFMVKSNNSNKVVLITGCSSGFGLLTAIEMAKANFKVFASMRDLNKRGELDKAAKDAQVSIDLVELDITKQESINKAIQEVEEKGRPIDILVNNAGFVTYGLVEELEMEDLKSQFETNFFGTVAMTKSVIPKMRERHTGHIINLSSIAGTNALPGW